jgi:hypothetical protein
MQQFFQFITLCLFTAKRVSGVLTPIIRNSITAVAASGFTFGALLSPRSNGKPEGATTAVEFLMMGLRTSETC